MSKETKNGLKTLVIGWVVLGLIVGLGVLMVTFPTLGIIVLIGFAVTFLSVLLFLAGTSF